MNIFSNRRPCFRCCRFERGTNVDRFLIDQFTDSTSGKATVKANFARRRLAARRAKKENWKRRQKKKKKKRKETGEADVGRRSFSSPMAAGADGWAVDRRPVHRSSRFEWLSFPWSSGHSSISSVSTMANLLAYLSLVVLVHRQTTNRVVDGVDVVLVAIRNRA